MKLYLSSSKLGNKTEILKEWIKDNNNNLIALIKNSRDFKEQNEEEHKKIQSYIKLLEEVGFKVEILDLKKYFGNKELLNKEIKKYKAFCVVGGNVFVLRQAMKLSGFDKYLIENKNEEILYFGWSAGSCVLSSNLEPFKLVDEELNPYNNDKVIYEGIGFLDKMFIPHYKSDHKETHLIDNLVDYLIENKIEFKTLSDGEVLIKEI